MVRLHARVLSTLIPPQAGTAQILGLDLRRDQTEIRRRIGVVFQAPSLDRKLTVAASALEGSIRNVQRTKIRNSRTFVSRTTRSYKIRDSDNGDNSDDYDDE